MVDIVFLEYAFESNTDVSKYLNTIYLLEDRVCLIWESKYLPLFDSQVAMYKWI